MRLKILGKVWKLVWLPKGETLDCDGETMAKTDKGICEAPSVKGKRIVVRAGMSDELTMDTLIHECLHAAAYDVACETWVNQTAHDIARVLHRLGWRRVG